MKEGKKGFLLLYSSPLWLSLISKQYQDMEGCVHRLPFKQLNHLRIAKMLTCSAQFVQWERTWSPQGQVRFCWRSTLKAKSRGDTVFDTGDGGQTKTHSPLQKHISAEKDCDNQSSSLTTTPPPPLSSFLSFTFPPSLSLSPRFSVSARVCPHTPDRK